MGDKGKGNVISKVAPFVDSASSLVGGVVSGLFSRKAATTAFHRQQALMDKQYQQQRQLNQSAESDRIQSIRQAGMNPLFYDGGSAPSAAGGTAPQAVTPDFRPNLSVTDKLRVSKELESLESQIEATNAERDLKTSQRISQDIRNAVDKQWLGKNTEQQFNLLASQIGLNEQNSRERDIFNQHAHEIYTEQARALRGAGLRDYSQANLNDKQYDWVDRLNMSKIERAATENKRDLAAASQSYALVKNLVALTSKVHSETDLNHQMYKFLEKRNPEELRKLQADIDDITKGIDLKDSELARKEIEQRLMRIEEKHLDRRLTLQERQAMADIVLKSAQTIESGTRSAGNIVSGLFPWQ